MRARQQGFLPLLFLEPVFGFLKAIPWQVWVVLGVVVAHFILQGIAVHTAVKNNDAKWQAREDALVVKHNKAMADTKQESKQSSDEDKAGLQLQLMFTQQQLESTLKELHAHVTKADDQRCGALPDAGLRDLADLAFPQSKTVSVPGGTRGPDKGPGLLPGGPVFLSDLFKSDAINIAKLQSCAAEVATWRSWYPKQKAICVKEGTCE